MEYIMEAGSVAFPALFGEALFTFFVCNIIGFRGAIIRRGVKKGKIKSGDNYFPQYFYHNDAFSYVFRLYLEIIFFFGGISTIATGCLVGNALSVLIGVVFIAFAIILRRTQYKGVKNDIIDKYGEEEGKRIYRLFVSIGLGELIKDGWYILLIVVILVASMFGGMYDDGEYDYDPALDTFFRKNNY